jgi:hypothetical protein
VEEVVYATQLVGECAAFGVPHPSLGEAVVVAVTPRAGLVADPERLLQMCKERLPAYMVPSRFEWCEGPLPRNAKRVVPTRTRDRDTMTNVARHPSAARFALVGGEVAIGGIALSVLAARVGRTPFYAYDRHLLKQRVAELRAALPVQIGLHYAIKANPMPAVVGWMARWVDGLDVASGGELRVALDAGMDPTEISFAGPGKNEIELTQAVAAGVLVNAESERELHLLAAIAQRLGKAARVALRINPDFELKSSGMKMGGGPKQFGIDAEAAPAALALAGRLGLGFEGFHIFSGSQNLRAEAICEAQSKALALAVRLAAQAPGPVRMLNIGGGFGIPYFPGESALDLARVGAHLHGVLEAAGTCTVCSRLLASNCHTPGWSSSWVGIWWARLVSTCRA